MSDDNPVLFARQAVLASQLRMAAHLVGDASKLMSEYEREHSEDLFDELEQVSSRLQRIAGLIERGQEWSE